ncbi:hypothetical protein ILYODFUR_027000 [Ilyodon furcidens]|uniref:Uncharacterized protein n=1 Tax=Ilyodon furcidens TaxID=33524 RepID=A0ABV0ULN5_9TELE
MDNLGTYSTYCWCSGQGSSCYSYSSWSVGSDHMGQLSEPTCIMSHDLSLVHHCSFLGPLLTDTNHCRSESPCNSCSSGEALTQISSRHTVVLVVAQNFKFDIF